MSVRLRRARGFTLVEVLVASTVVLLAVGMATMGLLSQNKSLQSADLTRLANESIRDAMLQLEGSLRQAGWGIDPRYAIDMKTQCPSTGVCRDSTTGPDQLAFVARNPVYRWRDNGVGGCTTSGGCFTEGNIWSVPSGGVSASASGATVTVQLRAGQVIEKGRVILVTCAGGKDAVMLTMGARYEGGTSGATVQLASLGTEADPYNDLTTTSGITTSSSLKACHSAAGAGVFLVDRYRYFIQTFNGTPWLMLDTGLDRDADGNLPPADTDDLIPVAENVEDMQVAYFLQRDPTRTAPDSGADWIIGNNRASTTPEEPNYNATAPTYATGDNDPSRFNMHPANVRGVRVTLTLRSARTDPARGPTWAGETVTGAENRSGTLSGGAFRRYVVQTELTLRNLESKSPFTF